MAAFFSLLSRVFRRRPPRISGLKPALLGRLPVELILHITQFLDPASAASFSLCCQPIRNIIGGAQYLEALHHEDREAELLEFLTLWELDLPDHVACLSCKKFHAIERAIYQTYKYHGYYDYPGRSVPACWGVNLRSKALRLISSQFSWTIFHMAMKRYRQGRPYTGLLGLMTVRITTSWYPGHVRHATTLFRVVEGSLLAREQRVFLPLRGDEGWSACPHHTGYRFEIYLQDRMTRRDEPESREAGLTRCEYCLTEFRLDFQAIEGEGVALFSTRWQNLGRGISPSDLEWRSHVYGSGGKRSARLWERVYFERGSIRDAFEGGDSPEFTSLLTSSCLQEWLRRSYVGRFYDS